MTARLIASGGPAGCDAGTETALMAATTTGASAGPGLDPIPRRAWLALLVSTIVVFLVVIDISAVNVAFPSIREDFEVSASELSWILSAYNIVVGALLMLSGRLADSIGRRKVYLPGVGHVRRSARCCAPWRPVRGLVDRGPGGAGGRRVDHAGRRVRGDAARVPPDPAGHRDRHRRGDRRSLGAVVGPVVGSLIIDVFSWRGIFWLNVPLCVLVLFLGPRLLRESRDPNATGRIDPIGVPIGTAAVALVMFGIVQSESWGIGDVRVIALVLVGLALVPVLIHRCRVHPEPLIQLDLFSLSIVRQHQPGRLASTAWGSPPGS